MNQYKQYPSFKVFSWSIHELNGLSYRSLQQEAKIHGIRAKQKKSLLLDALVKKFNEKQAKIKKIYAVLKIQMWWKNTLFIKHTIPTLKSLRLIPNKFICDRYYVKQDKPYGTIRVRYINFIQKKCAARSLLYNNFKRKYILKYHYRLYGLNRKLNKELFRRNTPQQIRNTFILPSKVVAAVKDRKEWIRLNKLEEYIAHGHITIDNLENELVKTFPGDKLKILNRREEREQIRLRVEALERERRERDRKYYAGQSIEWYGGGMWARGNNSGY